MTTTAKKKDEARDEPVVTTEVTLDGLRAIDTSTAVDGTTWSTPRDATFAEQVERLAPEVLDQAIRMVHWAESGSVETDGGTITIRLVER